MRNVISLSNISPELHQWFKNQAAHRSAQTGKRTTMYQIIVTALEEYRERELVKAATPQPEVVPGDGRYEYYLADGSGPYHDLQTALSYVELKGHKRPKHNRYDRLSTFLKSQIERREKTPPEPCITEVTHA